MVVLHASEEEVGVEFRSLIPDPSPKGEGRIYFT